MPVNSDLVFSNAAWAVSTALAADFVASAFVAASCLRASMPVDNAAIVDLALVAASASDLSAGVFSDSAASFCDSSVACVMQRLLLLESRLRGLRSICSSGNRPTGFLQ